MCATPRVGIDVVVGKGVTMGMAVALAVGVVAIDCPCNAAAINGWAIAAPTPNNPTITAVMAPIFVQSRPFDVAATFDWGMGVGDRGVGD